MTNADLFKDIFGIYATELWAMPEPEFLEWLNSKSKTGKWKHFSMGDDEGKIKPCTAEYQRVYMQGWNEGRRKLLEKMEDEVLMYENV